jgi:predicted transcriptional regulator
MNQARISIQISLLAASGLIEHHYEDRRRMYRLTDSGRALVRIARAVMTPE